ncbi:MAG: two-component system sensor histidine kinase ChvG [Glaciecola sp.]|jgi:two-component system sensor histidine kinase ChvG
MTNWRISLRVKLLFFSSFLFAIPYLGYQYVWELETYLRIGQEQTMVGTARAVATALHERPKLFSTQSSFMSDVRPGTDLYAHSIDYPIQLDGDVADWDEYSAFKMHYAEQNLIEIQQAYRPQSLSFKHMIGRYDKFLYAVFEVNDDSLVFRARNSLRIDRNDYLQIAMTDIKGEFQRYIVAPMQSGWVNAYLLKQDSPNIQPERLETKIQGYWQQTEAGYTVELRIPVGMMSSKIAFAISDVDDAETRFAKYTLGTADPTKADSLGTILIPSPDIENILKGLQYANARVWVIDKHMRVLAKSGEIQSASGVQAEPSNIASAMPLIDEDADKDEKSERESSQVMTQENIAETPKVRTNETKGIWEHIESEWLLPIYYKILTKPPADFVDDLDNAFALEGKDIEEALDGTPSTLWRLSADKKAVILSAAHPIYIDEQVMGAVVVEQTTNGIRTLRNQALEKQFHFILAVIVLGTLSLFLLASRISWRIRKLRNETESAIDSSGKIIGEIKASPANDEIGDLSRTFNNVLSKLSQYNSYLENMASRLSHELRTPVAIVNSSLDNLSLDKHSPDNQAYIDRAKEGITRLSKILSNMSEATRLEQAIQNSDVEAFSLNEVLVGCTEGYRLAYSERQFLLETELQSLVIEGAPELFAQMLDKIVANAVEFSPQNSLIRIALKGSENAFRIHISNQGPLLPENMQKELLDSMISVRKEQGSEQAHLGLGLYIAKMIALFHHASIDIENQTDESGVVVTLSFKSR